MLSIRMQRTGRKGHAMFRLVVQESRYTPTSGKVVAQLGSFDPHSKTSQVDSEKANFYLKHGAQPSSRAASVLQKEGIELPKWVTSTTAKDRKIRNPDKLRRNQPKVEAAKAEAAPVEVVPTDAPEVQTGTTES